MQPRTLGKFIAELRKEKNLTQRELGNILGVSDKTISHWEREESSPDISALPLLAKTLEITIDELLAGEKTISTENKVDNTATVIMQKKSVLSDRFRKFKVASVISRIIVSVSIINFTASSIISALGSEIFFIPFLAAVLNPLISFIITVASRIYLSSNAHPNKEEIEENKSILLKANKITFINILLFVFSIMLGLIPIFVTTGYYITIVCIALWAVLLIGAITSAFVLKKRGVLA